MRKSLFFLCIKLPYMEYHSHSLSTELLLCKILAELSVKIFKVMCNPCHCRWSSVISSWLLGGWILWISLFKINLLIYVLAYNELCVNGGWNDVPVWLWDSHGHTRSVTCALIQGLKTDRYSFLSFYTCFFQLQKERCNHYLCMKDSLTFFPVGKYINLKWICVWWICECFNPLTVTPPVWDMKMHYPNSKACNARMLWNIDIYWRFGI